MCVYLAFLQHPHMLIMCSGIVPLQCIFHPQASSTIFLNIRKWLCSCLQTQCVHLSSTIVNLPTIFFPSGYPLWQLELDRGAYHCKGKERGSRRGRRERWGGGSQRGGGGRRGRFEREREEEGEGEG